MERTLTIAGLGGSVASASRSRAALQTALEGAASAGARTELLDLRALDLPMFSPEDEPTSAVDELIETCHAADGRVARLTLEGEGARRVVGQWATASTLFHRASSRDSTGTARHRIFRVSSHVPPEDSCGLPPFKYR